VRQLLAYQLLHHWQSRPSGQQQQQQDGHMQQQSGVLGSSCAQQQQVHLQPAADRPAGSVDANIQTLHQVCADGIHTQPTRTAAVAASAGHSHTGSSSAPRLKAAMGTDRSSRSGSGTQPGFKLLGWLVQAGFSGMKLACQLLWLVVALLVGRVVARCILAAKAVWSTSA
jgi:hypothetical protein